MRSLFARWFGSGPVEAPDSSTDEGGKRQETTGASQPGEASSAVHARPLAVILTYYNQADVLKDQVRNWAGFPKSLRDEVTFLIVDDGSRREALPAIEAVEEGSDLDLRIYRILEDKYCNIGGARNLGSEVAESPWLLHTDVDIVLTPEAVAEMLRLVKEGERRIYKFNRRFEDGTTKIHPGTMLLSRALYWEVGGCDEDFVGNYGQTDIHFFHRADQVVETVIRDDVMLGFRGDGETREIDRARLEPNRRLLEEKLARGNWSDEFLRFAWERVR